MKTHKNELMELIILGTLGLLVVLTLLLPQLLRDRDDGQLIFLSVLLRDTDSAGFAAARQGMEQAADELGAELRFLTPTVQGDSREQAELLRREAEGGADALIAIPADTASLEGALSRLSPPRPMIALGAPVAGGAGTVSPDNVLLGRELARTLLEDWDGGLILLLDNTGSCPEVSARLEGAFEVLTEAEGEVPVLVLDYGYWDSLRGAEWVMTFEPGATQRAAEWKEAEGEDFTLYGVGSSTAVTALLERGSITAVAAWSDYAAGYLAVRQAVLTVQEQPQDLDPLTFSIVRGEDIYAPENQKLLFPVTS